MFISLVLLLFPDVVSEETSAQEIFSLTNILLFQPFKLFINGKIGKLHT